MRPRTLLTTLVCTLLLAGATFAGLAFAQGGDVSGDYTVVGTGINEAGSISVYLTPQPGNCPAGNGHKLVSGDLDAALKLLLAAQFGGRTIGDLSVDTDGTRVSADPYYCRLKGFTVR